MLARSREIKEIRDMSVANKTMLDARIAADLDHHRIIEQGLASIRSETDRRHAENGSRFATLDRNIEQLDLKMDASVADLHGRITRLGTEIGDKVNGISTDLSNKINDTAWGGVKWLAKVIGAIALVCIAVIGFLITQGPPWAKQQTPVEHLAGTKGGR